VKRKNRKSATLTRSLTRIGETGRPTRGLKVKESRVCEFEPYDLVAAVENVCRIPREDFCGPGKSAPAIRAKEMLILIGLQMGANMKVLSEIIGISPSSLSRRHDAARLKARDNANINKLAAEIIQEYRSM
jgi:hypothetical protein